MHRLFLGCNLWNALFLVAAAALGWAGSPHHVRVAVFAAVFACLVQCGVVALFLGAAKLVKEHVARLGMPMALIDRVNHVYHKLVPMAAAGAVAVAAAAIVGGLADLGRAPLWLHHAMALGAGAYLIGIIPIEYFLHRRMHGVLADVERLLPPGAEPGRGPDGHVPEEVALDRGSLARALLYVGLTLPLPYFGYTFIAGRDVSFLMVPTLVLAAACLGGSAWLRFRSQRERPERPSGRA